MVEHKKASDPDTCVWVFLKTYLFSMRYGCSYTHKQDDDVQKLFSVFRSRRNRHFERITETPANISICSIAGKCELCYNILEYLRLHADRMDVTVSIFRKTQLWKGDKSCY